MRMSLLPVILLAACSTGDGVDSGGVEPQQDTPPGLDTEFEQGLTTEGTELTQCETLAMLDIVNQENLRADDLVTLGVHSRAANNIEQTRRGPDGIYGTSDDVIFLTLQELDDVPFVGPAAMEALQEAGAEVCAGGELDLGPSCAEAAVLDLTNDPNTTADDLRNIGVHSAGATSIIEARNGADATPGTADDLEFTSINDLDAVPQVGPATLQTLLAWGQAECATTATVFSSPTQPGSHLSAVQTAIHEAQTSIDIACHSLSDPGVLSALRAAVQRGVTVRIVAQEARYHQRSPAGTSSATLEDMGIEVVWVNKTLHHQFALIDGPRAHLSQAPDALLITGSAGWSPLTGSAADNNTLFIRGDARLALHYQREFEHLWNHSRPVIWNEHIPHLLGLEISEADIETAPGSDALFTSANMRTWNSASYGPTFSHIPGERVVQSELAHHIQRATSSIRMASTHLRSRAVYHALIDARARKPNLQIQVYLDGQEFSSQAYWNSDVAEHDSCVAALGEQDCLDDAARFGTGLHLAGIDVRYKLYAYHWHESYAQPMNHKYLLIDNNTLITGSYDLTPSAESTSLENLAVLSGNFYPELVSEYNANFSELWNTGRSRYSSLLDQVRYGQGSFPIVFEPMALGWSDVSELRQAMRDSCPQIESDSFLRDPAAHQTCSR